MSYGKVHDAYWNSDRISQLSDKAALLGLFLLTGEHRNAIGCFKLGIGAITDVERFGNWGSDTVSDTLSELCNIGFIERDFRTGWTLILKHLDHDPVRGPKVGAHAVALAHKVPRSLLLYRTLKSKLDKQLEAAFAKTIAEGRSVDGFPLPLAEEAIPDTLPDRVSDTEPIPRTLNLTPEPEPKYPCQEVELGGATRTHARGGGPSWDMPDIPPQLRRAN